jgi:hypothetical protein
MCIIVYRPVCFQTHTKIYHLRTQRNRVGVSIKTLSRKGNSIRRFRGKISGKNTHTFYPTIGIVILLGNGNDSGVRAV